MTLPKKLQEPWAAFWCYWPNITEILVFACAAIGYMTIWIVVIWAIWGNV